MRGLLRRIRPAGEAEDGSTPVVAGDPAEPIADSAAEGPGPDTPALDARQTTPAGVAPEDLIGDPPDTRRRGRLRRRLRHLRQVRELMLRDIGGLMYEFHRAGARAAPEEPGSALIGRKLDRLAVLDAERHELEELLDDRRAETVLREPGVGGTCPACGEYFASDARFCSHCGERVNGRAGGRGYAAEHEHLPVAVGADGPAPTGVRAERTGGNGA